MSSLQSFPELKREEETASRLSPHHLLSFWPTPFRDCHQLLQSFLAEVQVMLRRLLSRSVCSNNSNERREEKRKEESRQSLVSTVRDPRTWSDEELDNSTEREGNISMIPLGSFDEKSIEVKAKESTIHIELSKADASRGRPVDVHEEVGA